MTIKAIATRYNGYKFRSRLEARWAVFFDTLGLPYEYEKEGFDFDGTLYLPDFWLPTVGKSGTWIEIKPRIYDGSWPKNIAWSMYEQDYQKHSILYGLVMLCGEPYASSNNVFLEDFEGYSTARSWSISDDNFSYEGFVAGDRNYLWCECPKCHVIGIQYEGRAGRLCACFDYDKIYNTHSDRLLMAYTAARQSRFEHGEKP